MSPPDLQRDGPRSRAGQFRRRRVGAAMVLAAVAGALVALLSGTSEHTAATRVGSGSDTTPAHAAATPARGDSPVPGTAQAAALRRIAALGLPVYCAGARKPLIALTFDDGPGPYTGKAIRKLRKHGVRATFFLVGRSITSYPGLARLERAVGAVGDHTLTHPLLPALGAGAVAHEMAAAKTAIEANARQPVLLFRPPYGARSAVVDREARSLGLVDVIWSVDSRDSEGANYAQIAQTVIAGMRPGAIILMHENRGQTIRALLQILPAVRRKHLRAVTLPQLLAEDPPSAAQLRAGGRGCGSPVPARGGG